MKVQYVKCNKCKWISFISSAGTGADACGRCGNSNKFFTPTDGRELPRGCTVCGIRDPGTAAPLKGVKA